LTTGTSGSVAGCAVEAVVDAGAAGVTVGGGTAALGAGVVAVLGGASVGAAKRTQLIFLSLLSKALGMAGLTGLGGYCTHWSKRLGAAGAGAGVWAGLAMAQTSHPKPRICRRDTPTPAINRRQVEGVGCDGRKFMGGATG
jgi:surface antigen